MKRRLQVTIDEELDDKLEAYCKINHCSKSSIISTGTAQYLDMQEKMPVVVPQLEELKSAIDKLISSQK